MRNASQHNLALREVLRVLKPGGSFMILEFGEDQVTIVSQLYDACSLGIIPTICLVIAQDDPT